jgi:CheY-like chemotaxis protein
MNILVVEDDDNKRSHILGYLSSNWPDIHVETAESLIAALRAIKRGRHTIVLLDMTLPNYDLDDDGAGGGMHAFGGEEFLRQVKRLRIPTSVVVVTQFETFGEPPDTKNLAELDESLRVEFPNLYRGAIYYHASIHDWNVTLSEKLKDLIQESIARG